GSDTPGTDDLWWNGSDWIGPQSDPVYITVPATLTGSPTSQWLLNSAGIGAIDLHANNRYQVRSKAQDKALNSETSLTAGTFFYYDPAAPSPLTIQKPANSSTVKTLPVISGTVADTQNVKKVEIRVKRLAPTQYWK